MADMNSRGLLLAAGPSRGRDENVRGFAIMLCDAATSEKLWAKKVAARLPRLRERIEKDLRAPTLSRERVLAAAARLLDVGFFRIGGEEYADRNDSYGLTTMRREHVEIDGDQIIFDYPAKVAGDACRRLPTRRCWLWSWRCWNAMTTARTCSPVRIRQVQVQVRAGGWVNRTAV
ncbi:hypothetical protein I6A84_30385 [Frankia sp. CNm7]|uniref:DNA topoisomerase I catalytic core eukaryotic-type domain-containing protein n=1 Tax=Frankia nepalensis TaxID=1836974 RepID=A0A937R7Z8_9ACTN|nr:hypothetical protein [Frankia nepalensis]MBL7500834.1 hypothetical protein [Frankia nepalensis]MBL7515315.1 hypothetical protein [Frankia nepalensis]MBL7522272.1 hypothetical protein [Frankia nepalensis]MBL7627036.1 hypothetical protein [Frankia nepalensis]